MEKLKKMIYPLNLQLFAEGDGGEGDSGTAGGAEDGSNTEPSKEPEGNKTSTFTQEQLDDIISKRLAREKEKWETDQLKAKTEAQKLEKMTEAQKREYARQKKEDELTKREQEITKRELTAVAKEQLIEAKIPVELSEFLDYTDADHVKASVEKLTKSFNAALEKAIAEKIKGGKTLEKANQDNLTEEQKVAQEFAKYL